MIPREAWGAAMIYFTGSKAHNIRIREMAVRKGLKLNEYGLFARRAGELLAAETEEEVYERLGLPCIPPTLREDRGEVEAALAGDAARRCSPQRQIRGDLHTHTDLTDGLASLEQMLEAAAELRLRVLRGDRPRAEPVHAADDRREDARAARRSSERCRPAYPKMTLLHGTELNIDPDGGVDWDEDFLDGLRRHASPRCTRTSPSRRTR